MCHIHRIKIVRQLIYDDFIDNIFNLLTVRP